MSAATLLARDDLGTPIQILPYRPGGGWGVATGAASKTVGPFPQTTRVVTMTAIGAPVFWQPGAPGVTVTVLALDFEGNGPHYLAAGERIDVALGGGQGESPLATEIAVISANGTAGTVYVSERG